MKTTGFWTAAALSVGISAASAAPQVASAHAQRSSDDGKEVTLIGCVVKGDGGYVLTNVAEQTAAAAIAGALPSTPQPSGTVLPGRVLYWMTDDEDLADHAGHKVEVRGALKGEIEKGKISAEREGGLVELEFKVDGDKKVTIKVPDVPPTIGTGGSVGGKEVDFHYIVRKVDVDSVKMITSTCN